MIIEKEADIKGNRFYSIITEPYSNPVTVDEVKEFARIDGEDEDDILETFIESVVKLTEAYLGRSLVNRTIRMIMDTWTSREIELPYPPLVSISSVQTIDESNTATTYSSDNYYTITESIPGRLLIKKDSELPSNTERNYGGYRITYIAGYGNSREDVPQQIRTAIKQWVTLLYENRSMVENDMIKNEPPPEVKKGLLQFRVVRI